MSHTDLTSPCRGLIAQLDTFRSKWLEIALELVDDAIAAAGDASLSLVNREFDVDRDVGATASDTPADFPFNTIDGETVEAAVIGLQSSVAIQFCLTRGYIGESDFPHYYSALLAASAGNLPWLFSIGTLFGESTLSVKTVAFVLSRYLLNDKSASRGVSIAEVVLEERLPFLAYLSQVGTAVAFNDHATATSMMQQLSR
jgi:hypothetical protein